MAISLQKGQTIDLTKNRSDLNHITIGLSWGTVQRTPKSETKSEPKGLLARAFDRLMGKIEEEFTYPQTMTMDIDSSVAMLTDNGSLYDLVYFGHRTSKCQSIKHAGDDLTGRDHKGIYDNEEIYIDLARVPQHVTRLVFIANVYQGIARGQHFGQVKGAYIRVLKSSDREELVRYSLADEFDGMRGLIVGEMYRYQGYWKFRAIGQGTKTDQLKAIVQTL